MSLPSDHLRPIFRQRPGNGGVFTIALDPREAEFVLERGWATLDGVRYKASTDGCGDELDWDGRRMIRCDGPPLTTANEGDATDRWIRRALRILRAA
jgi:hypothetical protein